MDANTLYLTVLGENPLEPTCRVEQNLPEIPFTESRHRVQLITGFGHHKVRLITGCGRRVA